jgi:hypothetical protein
MILMIYVWQVVFIFGDFLTFYFTSFLCDKIKVSGFAGCCGANLMGDGWKEKSTYGWLASYIFVRGSVVGLRMYRQRGDGWLFLFRYLS